MVRCIGTHKDVLANPYMQFTAREYFYQGKTNVKVTVVLRNANWDTSASPSPDCHYNSNSTQCNGGSFDSRQPRASGLMKCGSVRISREA